MTDITALGDSVNIAARLAYNAAAGEIIISEDALKAANFKMDDLEHHPLELKGKNNKLDVREIWVGH